MPSSSMDSGVTAEALEAAIAAEKGISTPTPTPVPVPVTKKEVPASKAKASTPKTETPKTSE